PVVEPTDEVLSRGSHVREVHLAEVRVVLVGEGGEGTELDPWLAHGDDDAADALVFRHRGIGPHEAPAVLRVARPGGPHLLAVDHEVVAVEFGAGRQAGEVAARVRLAEAQAPGDLRTKGREHPLPPLRLVPELEDRRRHDRQPLGVVRAPDAEAVELLEVGHLLSGGGTSPTELRRPPGNEPACVEEASLPFATPWWHRTAGELSRSVFGRGRVAT